MTFETKKIQHETLGEYLAEVRLGLGLSVQEAAAKTAVNARTLQAIEAGDFEHLPADVYVLGGLRELAQLYGVDGAAIVAQYKKERSIFDQLKTVARVRSDRQRRAGRFVFTPKVVSIVLGLLAVVATLGYIGYQISAINRTPSLTITEPTDRQVISGTTVSVTGNTDPGSSVSINDQLVFVGRNGEFKAGVSVGAGPKEFRFVAKNKFGKELTKVITVVGEATVEPQGTSSPVTLMLTALAQVNVGISVDGGELRHEVIATGSSVTVSGNEQVRLSADDAGRVRVTFNGRDLGLLGRAGERIDEVPFLAEKK